MSQDENQNSGTGAEVTELFARVRNAKMETSPQLRARVLAELEKTSRQAHSLFVWKTATVSFAFLALLLGMLYWSQLKERSLFLTGRSYVIQADFDAQETFVISQVEAVLPGDVYFVSAEGPVKDSHSVKLPYEIQQAGLNKLPFVVSSESSGKKEIVLRFYNQNDQVLREKKLILEFKKDRG